MYHCTRNASRVNTPGALLWAPADGTELPALLDDAVQEALRVNQRAPLLVVDLVQQVLQL